MVKLETTTNHKVLVKNQQRREAQSLLRTWKNSITEAPRAHKTDNNSRLPNKIQKQIQDRVQNQVPEAIKNCTRTAVNLRLAQGPQIRNLRIQLTTAKNNNKSKGQKSIQLDNHQK